MIVEDGWLLATSASALRLTFATRDELLLFAAVGLLIGGAEDVVLDLLYFVRRIWRNLTVYRRTPRMTADTLPAPQRPGTMAVFVPAWDEGAVIDRMLRLCLARWARDDLHLFVGVYPNDPATLAAVADVAATAGRRITIVVNNRPGPTTKADCLNSLWRALERWEAERGARAKAVVLHDAEDVVHADALRVMSVMVERFALVQLPVLPLASTGSRWVAGHYCDEFAESHAKTLAVREALGAAMPSAGVGCAFARDALQAIAQARGGLPFDADSLTEDYELGLRIGEQGRRGILVRMRDADGELIATREYFPDSIEGAVRQKARWTVGIVLAGWDRLGWGHDWIEAWMRLRDRRALLSAVVLTAAYAAMMLALALTLADAVHLMDVPPLPDPLPQLLGLTLLLLLWRVAMRALFVFRAYGLAEALRSIPRMALGNIIAILAARRALFQYLRMKRGAALRWDKTRHRFPDLGSEGAA